ncbi:MAG: hypothetical protein OEM15_09235 [Myxococcales bacterium]|nr:hypothetical protein [Myxococcales bacterium]MDH3485703.1 hypothetical protein [Myxococcales bacterium]
MVHRGFTQLLVAAMVAASGLGGAALHLCQMEGAVRSTCCCHQSEHEQPPIQLKRVDECCGALLPQSEQPPVLTTHDISIESSLMLAALVASPELSTATRGSACILPPVRGPPPEHGPPLFIQHCSFLN